MFANSNDKTDADGSLDLLSEEGSVAEKPRSAPSAGSMAALMSGGGGGQGEFVLPEERRVSAGTIAVGGLVVVGAVGLWFMKSRTSPAAAEATVQTQAAQESIRQFLSGGDASLEQMRQLLADTEKVKQQFLAYPTNRQVPLDELKTNPFYHEEPARPADKPEAPAIAEMSKLEAELLAEKQRKAVIDAAGKLRLTSVMYGTHYRACMINGTLCEAGSVIDGFTIVVIRPDSVQVERDGYHLLLPMRP